jgi:hypothetical protein
MNLSPDVIRAQYFGEYLFLIFVSCGVAAVAAMILLRRYLHIGREGGWLLGVAIVLSAAGAGAYHGFQLYGVAPDPFSAREVPAILSASFLVICGASLVIKIHRAWMGIHITDAEKLPGIAGIRAWLSPTNVILALITSFCAWYGFGYPFLPIFALAALILLAYPIAHSMIQNTTPKQPSEEKDNLASERERVLSMLDAGKITAEESAELLNALAATVQASGTPDSSAGFKIAPEQRMILVGAVIVLIGFFLPWFSIDPAKELERIAGDLSKVAQPFGGSPGINSPSAPSLLFGQDGSNAGFPFKAATINIAGGDIAHGLGWLVLVLGAGVAILPYIATELERQTCRMIDFLALGGGVIILLYLLADNFRFVNAGIVLAIMGYMIEFVGVIRQAPRVHSLPDWG